VVAVHVERDARPHDLALPVQQAAHDR
jgi:hypothetical protein